MPRKRKRHEAFDDSYNRRTDHNRVNLTNRPITGEVVTWLKDRGFGWVHPHEDLSHLPNVAPNAQIFIHRRDCMNRNNAPKQGDQVRFMLYMDNRGLGGDECSIFSGHDPSGFPKSKRATNEAQIAIIHLLVDDYYLERILGTRCTVLTSLKKEFGVDIRIVPGLHRIKGDYARRVGSEEKKLIRFEGGKDDTQKCMLKISKLLTGTKQPTAKMLFLLRQDQAGRFIGKGGATLKKVRGDNRRVQVNVNKQILTLNEQKFLTISLRGPVEDLEGPIKETISLLHSFHGSILQKQEIIYPLTPFEHQNPLSRGLNL